MISNNKLLIRMLVIVTSHNSRRNKINKNKQISHKAIMREQEDLH